MTLRRVTNRAISPSSRRERSLFGPLIRSIDRRRKPIAKTGADLKRKEKPRHGASCRDGATEQDHNPGSVLNAGRPAGLLVEPPRHRDALRPHVSGSCFQEWFQAHSIRPRIDNQNCLPSGVSSRIPCSPTASSFAIRRSRASSSTSARRTVEPPIARRSINVFT